MNMIEHISIEGEIQRSYMRIFAEYSFHSSDGGEGITEFFFPVPEGSYITGLQFMTADRKLIRADVRGFEKNKFLNRGESLIQVTPQVYCLSWSNKRYGGICSVLVELLCPLRTGNGAEFVFPLGMKVPSYSGICTDGCTADIVFRSELDNIRAVSLTHDIDTRLDGGGAVFTASAEAGTDFAVSFVGFNRESFGMTGGGTGVYRLYSADKEMYKRELRESILLILDTSEAVSENEVDLVKELLYRVTNEIDEGTKIQIISSAGTAFSEFILKDKGVSDIVYKYLSDMETTVCRTAELLAEAVKYSTGETDIILVSVNFSMDLESEIYAQALGNLHIFTVGDCSTGFGYVKPAGVLRHFYPEDLTAEKVCEALKYIGESRTEISVMSDDGCASGIILSEAGCISAHGYIDIVLKYTGRLPQRFTLWQDGRRIETFEAENIVEYCESQILDKLYGCAEIHSLTLLADKLPPESQVGIKARIKRIGLENGIVTSETMLAISGEEGRTAEVPIRFCLGCGLNNGKTAKRPTVFGEDKADKKTEKNKRDGILKLCRHILYRCVCSDGAIASDMCQSENLRANQSAFGAAALQILGENAEFVSEFLKKNPPSGLAAQLYLHREDIFGFMKNHSAELLKNMPDSDELIRLLTKSETAAEAAGQIIIRTYLSEIHAD